MCPVLGSDGFGECSMKLNPPLPLQGGDKQRAYFGEDNNIPYGRCLKWQFVPSPLWGTERIYFKRKVGEKPG
jgi:hypothetical protein